MTACVAEMMTGLSIRMGWPAIALTSSSSDLSDDRLSSLNIDSPRRMRSIADTPSKLNIRLISLSVGGVSKYLTHVGLTPRSSSKANAVRDFEQRGLCQIVIVVISCPSCRKSGRKCRLGNKYEI